MKHTPQLVLLRAPEEDPSKLMDAPPEQLLLRWLNYHLTRPQSPTRADPDSGPPSHVSPEEANVWQGREPVRNFSHDLADGVAMVGLLHSLAPDVQLHCRWAAVCESPFAD